MRNLLLGVVMLLSVAACTVQTVSDEPPLTNEPDATLPATDEALGTAATTSTHGMIPTSTPLATSPTEDPAQVSDGLDLTPQVYTDKPTFMALRFIDHPDAATGFSRFPDDIEEIWAVWHYFNMSTDDVVKREWYKDGQVWLVREEAWDFATYGAEGIMRDISIHDYEIGLDRGSYSLRLYINGVEQFFHVTSFNIGNSAYPSPDGSRTAILRPPGTLLLNEPDGTQTTIAEQVEIVEAEWFPDGQHLLYVVVDRGDAPAGPSFGWRRDLRIADLSTWQTHSLSEDNEILRNPAISPDGKVIALVSGSGFGDAGMLDLSLVFMFLDANFQRSSVVRLNEFGDPNLAWGFPSGTADLPAPGKWLNANQFQAIILMSDTLEGGIYVFNLLERTVERTGDLPPGFNE